MVMVRLVHLREGEKPEGDKLWLLIIKTHGSDYETLVCLGDGTCPKTLGNDPDFDGAVDRAQRAAEDLHTDCIYVIGERGR